MHPTRQLSSPPTSATNSVCRWCDAQGIAHTATNDDAGEGWTKKPSDTKAVEFSARLWNVLETGSAQFQDWVWDNSWRWSDADTLFGKFKTWLARNYAGASLKDKNAIYNGLVSDVADLERGATMKQLGKSFDEGKEMIGTENIILNGLSSVPDKLATTITMFPNCRGARAGGSGALALCLSSRRNMCVHEGVLAASDREGVDAACRSMTAPWAIERADKARRRRGGGAEAEAEGAPPSGSGSGSSETCSYYDGFREAGEATSMPSGVYDLDEIKKWGKSKNWCPYYLTRRAINHASVLVFNYQYMLDPKVAKMVSKELRVARDAALALDRSDLWPGGLARGAPFRGGAGAGVRSCRQGILRGRGDTPAQVSRRRERERESRGWSVTRTMRCDAMRCDAMRCDAMRCDRRYIGHDVRRMTIDQFCDFTPISLSSPPLFPIDIIVSPPSGGPRPRRSRDGRRSRRQRRRRRWRRRRRRRGRSGSRRRRR